MTPGRCALPGLGTRTQPPAFGGPSWLRAAPGAPCCSPRAVLGSGRGAKVPRQASSYFWLRKGEEQGEPLGTAAVSPRHQVGLILGEQDGVTSRRWPHVSEPLGAGGRQAGSGIRWGYGPLLLSWVHNGVAKAVVGKGSSWGGRGAGSRDGVG